MKLFREYVRAEVPGPRGTISVSKSFDIPTSEAKLIDVEDVSAGWYLTWIVPDDYQPGHK